MTTIEVIIPMRNMEAHVADCIRSLAGQLAPGDRITVVDDASSDRTASIAEGLGVTVVRRSSPRGPYSARHHAAMRSGAEILLFVDARCRALPGLVDAHRALFDDDGVTLTCTRVRVLTGGSLAGRIARASNVFDIDSSVGVPGLLDFFPTANLGVLRSSYIEVGGFRDMQSGGDADLCWRIQLAGLGKFGVDRRYLLEWIPRDSIRALLSQWRRYGESAAYLDALYPRTKMHPMARTSRMASVREAIRRAASSPAEVPIQLMVKVLNIFNARAYRRTSYDLAEVHEPAMIDAD